MDAEVPQTRVEELKGVLSHRQSALAAVRQQKRQAQEAALAARERATFLKKLTSPAEWKKVGVALLDNVARINAMRMGVRGASVANMGAPSTGAEGAISADAMAADAAGAAIEQEVVAMSAAELALERDIEALGNMLSGMGVKGGRRTRSQSQRQLRRRKNKSRSRRN
jgi:hypothetical protein